jgi:hypothetical protein
MDQSSHAPSPNILFFRCPFFGVLPRTGPGATKRKYSAADDDRDGVKMQPKHTVAYRGFPAQAVRYEITWRADAI